MYPGYPDLAKSPHCWAVLIDCPLAHALFHMLAPAKHPYGTPANAAPARMKSGYAPAKTLVIMAPEDKPVANTLSAGTPYLAIK